MRLSVSIVADRAEQYPNLFLVGAPRCGTTSVASVLNRHAEISFGAFKEPWFLNDDFGPRKITDESAYRAHFQKVPPATRFRLDASTTYFYSRSAREAIAGIPGVRVLIMIRNPVDMALSWHALKRLVLEEDIDDFESAWRAIGDRKAGKRVPDSLRERRWLYYDEMAALGTVCDQWLGTLGSARVSVLLFDDMRRDPARFFEDLFESIGVEPDASLVGGSHISRRRRSRNLLVAKAIAKIADIKRRYLPVSLGINLLSRIQEFNRVYEDPRSALRPQFRSELNEFFRGEVRILEGITGRSLAHWLET